jgi:hypothetical protein
MKKFNAEEMHELDVAKWIASEKAGRDLGKDFIEDWIIKHAPGYRKKWGKQDIKSAISKLDKMLTSLKDSTINIKDMIAQLEESKEDLEESLECFENDNDK